ncbi:receptor-transporting protein 3-like isoform X1 [Littorina saxatilis]|uniref:receptor-transporting protein 3-like isoform X1 n=1 Tax=Littorina saxatilis TaxID=31220 RepID=UPI0038B45E63
MLVPCYVSVFNPAAGGRHSNGLVPAAGELTKGGSSSPPVTPMTPVTPVNTMSTVNTMNNVNSVSLLNEFVTFFNSGVAVSAPVSPSASMELVWHGEFERLFSQYFPHSWFLLPTFYAPSERWQIFKDSAKVRFSCGECGHGWTSMKGRVIFWFHLNYATNTGHVLFKLYGQQCQKCNNGKFEHAMWYPEEVVKVIGNVYNRVGQCYYGFVRPPLRIDRRQGKPRNQHNAELCQACKEGLCKEEWAIAAAAAASAALPASAS